MRLVVGLGNIGKEFEKTNHNMGFVVASRLAKEIGASIKKSMCNSTVGEANVKGEKIIIALPTTYMNNSGIAVKSLVKKFDIDIKKDLLIISDDIDLPVGKVRVRERGSAGTHNGLRSVVRELQTEDFPRLRIGVGKPNVNESLRDFVVSNARESKELDDGLLKGLEACLMFVNSESFSAIMQKVN